MDKTHNTCCKQLSDKDFIYEIFANNGVITNFNKALSTILKQCEICSFSSAIEQNEAINGDILK